MTVWKEFKVVPTCEDWLTSSRGTGNLLAVGFEDGSIQLINQNGQTDKNIAKAHEGAVRHISELR